MRRPPFYEVEMGQCHCGCGRYLMWRSTPDTPWYMKMAMFIGWWKHGRKANPATTQMAEEIAPVLKHR